MAELLPKERLQPSLLDRLSDDEPYKKVESRDQRVLSFQRLKRSVVRDLEWLLNAGCLEPTLDLTDFPEVKRSVLNYGVPDLTGTTASNLDAATLERMLRHRIVTFEPRLLSRSLKVRVTNKDEHNTVIIEIEGELWSQPMPERLYLKTILDLELGDFEVKGG
ncbi:MAG: type VI secretion system baseplate subunit TssE [Desulfobacteraceae bacterium]|jgi:type VI secretion system protein ImpF